jgi:kojibiose phosphorylase
MFRAIGLGPGQVRLNRTKEYDTMIRDSFSTALGFELPTDGWMVSEDAYEPDRNLQYESLFALSNGYLGIRGSHEEGNKPTLPYLYVNGVFDKSETFMKELATLPNWLGIRLYVEKQLIGVDECEILEYRRALDLKHAALVKRVRLRDPKGRETLIEGVRFVSRAHAHRMAVRLWVTPLNYSGLIEVEQITDGSIINFYDAPRFKVKHTVVTANEPLGENGVYMEVATRDENLHVGVGSHLEGTCRDRDVLGNRVFHAFGEQGVEFCDFRADEGDSVVLTKYVAMLDGRDTPADELHATTRREVEDFVAEGFEREFEAHADIYRKMWGQANIDIEGDPELDRAIRLNVFHLMSTANEHDDRVNVGAKLLTGEEYGGHAFWDTELFMLPFFAYVFPQTARHLESYRYRLLGAAEANAAKNGFQGAQYPWESADDGSEQCPDWTIEPDGTCYRCYVAVYEHHVTAAVAFGIANYAIITGDTSFLYGRGAEILTQTARFWASRCEWKEDAGRYEITQVTGPDEWHEPVDNNTYTNYLARWNMRYVIALVDRMQREHPDNYAALIAATGLTDAELASWDAIQSKIYLPRKEGADLLEQFEGYFDLEPVTIEEYDKNDWPVRPAALQQFKTSETQIIKQPDVVMLLHLLGNEFSQQEIETNYHYYEKRTLHGSSLSPSIYAIMGLKVGDDSKAYRYLRRAAMLDLLNLQHNTREGIHAANAGGIWQTVVFGFAGVNMDDDGVLSITPHMPHEWSSLTFRLHNRESWLEIRVDATNGVDVEVLDGPSAILRINGETVTVPGAKDVS